MDRDALMNELICLAEIRGELDDANNAKVEARIVEIRKLLWPLLF